MATNNLEIIIKAQNYASKELKKINKQVKGMKGTFKKAGKSVKEFGERNKETFKNIGIGAGVAVGAIGVMGKKFLDLGTDIQLTQKKANIVFGDYIGDVKRVAKETAKSMGLSQNEFLGASAGIQDLLIPMGFAREEATKMTTDMLGLAGALSEWSAGQYTAVEASEILAKAMLGETEQLKSMGIQVDISSKAFNERIKTMAEDEQMTLQQAKALDIQKQIFEKSTDAQNAFKEGGESLARQQAMLTATIKDARDSIAIALIPAMNSLIETMAPVITDLATSIKLWAENKENVESLKGTLVSTIEVFKTIGAIIGKVIWFLQKMGEMFGTIAAGIAITIGNITGDLQTFEGTAKTVTDNIGGFFRFLFEGIQQGVDAVRASLNAIKSLGSSVGSGLKSLGSVSIQSIAGARADGGPVSGGKSYLVGERGPELFTPGTSGNITSNEKMKGNSSVNINMGGVTVNNSADENRLVEKIKKALTTDAKLYNLGIT